MNIQVDTNILARIAQPSHPQQQPAEDAVVLLRTRGHMLCVVPQNLYEFWSVSTRPVSMNGLGKSAAETAAEVAAIQKGFALLDDTPAIFPQWLNLVITHGVLGKNAHDARLVAAMHVHGVTHLLTFNDQDFRRFPGITVWTPATVLTTAPILPTPPTP